MSRAVFLCLFFFFSPKLEVANSLGIQLQVAGCFQPRGVEAEQFSGCPGKGWAESLQCTRE